MASIELAPPAYGVLFMHCARYPHRTVNGLLLGSIDGETVRVREAMPLMHSSLALAPMQEAALLLADEYCSAKSLDIVGYYQANEVVDDMELGPYGKKLADKIRSQQKNAAILLLDGAKMHPAPGDLRLVTVGADGKRGTPPTIASDTEAALAKLQACISKGLHQEVVDFDVHLDVRDAPPIPRPFAPSALPCPCCALTERPLVRAAPPQDPTKDWTGNAALYAQGA